jgi:hypothetical protein
MPIAYKCKDLICANAIELASGSTGVDTALPTGTPAERGRELAVAVADQELEVAGAFAGSVSRLRLAGRSRSWRVAVTPRRCTRRVRISITDKRYGRLRKMVSECRNRMPGSRRAGSRKLSPGRDARRGRG